VTSASNETTSRSRVGGARPSQMLYTYGVGSQVDLPNFSVVVTGLDAWDQQRETIDEPRLLGAIREELGKQVQRLVAFPWLAGDNGPMSEAARVGVPVVPFPRWMRCPSCNTLATIDSGTFVFKPELYRPERSRFVHEQCSRAPRRPPIVIPARFVIACARGHLDEFPWAEFVHDFHACPNRADGAGLEMFDRGSGTRSTDVVVKCRYCNNQRVVANVFGPEYVKTGRFVRCRGRRPELRIFERACDELPEPMLLGASNLWFSITRSAFALPKEARDEIARLVAERWPKLEAVTSRDVLAYAVKSVVELDALRGYALDDVWAAVEAHRNADEAETEDAADLRRPEWEQFSAPLRAVPSEDFDIEARDVPSRYAKQIAAVIAARRLREVVALTGFARVEMPDIEPREGEAPDPARIGLSAEAPHWIPAVEVRGEGIFLRFDESEVTRWAVAAERSRHVAAFRAALPPAAAAAWRGARYLLLHSFAHLLINEVALDCGYSAASIRERIYASDGHDGEPMAGVLLYTASPDAEGTLGGLVSLAEVDRLGYLLGAAFERARVCGSDPLCADHLPEPGDTTLHGAACHACLFLPETSCERRNRYLDRTVLVETLANAGIAFFR
jgi:hypothetical protein